MYKRKITDQRKEYLRNYQRTWLKNRRLQFFKGKSCLWCKSTISLELDHINPKEKKSHSIWSWKESRRLEEIAKCQILCKSCHKIKSVKDGVPLAKHGNYNSYQRRKCRCSLCKAANAKKQRTVRENKRLR